MLVGAYYWFYDRGCGPVGVWTWATIGPRARLWTCLAHSLWELTEWSISVSLRDSENIKWLDLTNTICLKNKIFKKYNFQEALILNRQTTGNTLIIYSSYSQLWCSSELHVESCSSDRYFKSLIILHLIHRAVRWWSHIDAHFSLFHFAWKLTWSDGLWRLLIHPPNYCFCCIHWKFYNTSSQMLLWTVLWITRLRSKEINII